MVNSPSQPFPTLCGSGRLKIHLTFLQFGQYGFKSSYDSRRNSQPLPSSVSMKSCPVNSSSDKSISLEANQVSINVSFSVRWQISQSASQVKIALIISVNPQPAPCFAPHSHLTISLSFFGKKISFTASIASAIPLL